MKKTKQKSWRKNKMEIRNGYERLEYVKGMTASQLSFRGPIFFLF
ncbi:MAG: hypothetical protein ACFE75_06200 [Candidatus Hodarchaeota archaeon]